MDGVDGEFKWRCVCVKESWNGKKGVREGVCGSEKKKSYDRGLMSSVGFWTVVLSIWWRVDNALEIVLDHGWEPPSDGIKIVKVPPTAMACSMACSMVCRIVLFGATQGSAGLCHVWISHIAASSSSSSSS